MKGIWTSAITHAAATPTVADAPNALAAIFQLLSGCLVPLGFEFGRPTQVGQRNPTGHSIMHCPQIVVSHWEHLSLESSWEQGFVKIRYR